MAFSSIAKNMNRESIIHAMNDFQQYTKQDIARKTKLSFPTISKIVDELESEQIVLMLENKRSETGGRKAFDYILNKEYAYSLGIIVEYEKYKIVISNLESEIISMEEINEKKEVSPKSILKIIGDQIIKKPAIRSIVVGVPGAVHNGKIFLIDGIPLLCDCNLQVMIDEQFLLPTTVTNNLNVLISGKCAANETIVCIHINGFKFWTIDHAINMCCFFDKTNWMRRYFLGRNYGMGISRSHFSSDLYI